jgi:hypothetical protein
MAEAAGLRILCDPLLGPSHHAGVFEVVPRRALVAEALRPDFILVSHRHPDHFDVPSLHRLVRLDPDAVVVTPDPLVAWAARRLGARAVRELPPGHRVDLDGAALVTTPSLAPDEWGVMLATADGAAWNQVDTVLADPGHVRRVARAALDALGAADLALALVRWQPLLEVAAQLGRRAAFPYHDYAELLAAAAATGARAVVPSAAGEAHAAACTAMNQRVYPVAEPRFLRDLAALSPRTRGLPCSLGARYRVRAGEVACEPGDPALLVRLGGDDPRRFAPLELPPVRDPGLADVAEATQRADVERWVRGPLADGLARALPRGLRCALEVRCAAAVDVYTLTAGGPVARALDDDWDALTLIAGSPLWEVLQARRHWGDVLLAGALRACTRAYQIDERGLHALPIGEIFLYHGLAYDESVRRAVVRQVEDAVR